MLRNASSVAKLYFSIIDDVIDSVTELFLDEGLEDRVLDDLKHLWKSKLMQSKAMEDLRRTCSKSSNFVLQLPAGYSQADQDLAASVLIPAGQNLHVPTRNNAEALAVFSLPAGLTYPVPIPAGVTLQIASGQLYKVNVPVVVSQAPGGQPTQEATEWRNAAANPVLPHQKEPQEDASPPTQDGRRSPEPEAPLVESEPINLSVSASPCTRLLDDRIKAEEALMQETQGRDIEDILREVIEEERAKIQGPEMDDQLESALGLDLVNALVQLDGPADGPDPERGEEAAPVEETDFLGLISAKAVRALPENGSSEGNSSSSSSESEEMEDVADVEDEDPLNSGDDVIEQDIPDLFDTDNVIVCQYDKIHRSKNHWKFHLKDGMMSYGGRDYVFSKAVGEAEW